MKTLLLVLLAVVSTTVEAQFFKYSTFYVSGNISSPMAEQRQYMMDRETGDMTDITIVNPHDYKYNIGIRKIARFDYENKANQFYDGEENPVSNYATIGAVNGSEYLLSLEVARNRGSEFVNHEYWYRYVGKNFIVKAEYMDNQEIQLKTFGAEARGKINLGDFNLSAGVKHRSHPVYGINPFEENFDLSVDPWWSVAYDLGYTDEYWFFDGEDNGVDDLYDYYNWNWFTPEGVQIADTDEEFMRYHFGKAIDTYNRNELSLLGMQQEVSIVIGANYYFYKDNFWVHGWGDILPYHIGLSDFAYVDMDIPGKTNLDFNVGLITGAKITKKLGVFTEGRYQRYWDIKNYEIKMGVNYSIF